MCGSERKKMKKLRSYCRCVVQIDWSVGRSDKIRFATFLATVEIIKKSHPNVAPPSLKKLWVWIVLQKKCRIVPGKRKNLSKEGFLMWQSFCSIFPKWNSFITCLSKVWSARQHTKVKVIDRQRRLCTQIRPMPAFPFPDSTMCTVAPLLPHSLSSPPCVRLLLDSGL